ncbi:MAG: GAF domain-containing protein [Anaerolineales bacterium]|nr:GAF domain-containing protein [Anaerolineales bacterium]
MANKQTILLALSDNDSMDIIEKNILAPHGYQIITADNFKFALDQARTMNPGVIILGDNLPGGDYFDLAYQIAEIYPRSVFVLFTDNAEETLPKKAMGLEIIDWLHPPLLATSFLSAVERAMESRRMFDTSKDLTRSAEIKKLENHIQSLEKIAVIGRTITATLDIDKILVKVVETAISFTNADEGSILLLDKETNTLEMRAALNFRDEFVRTFSIPVDDSLAGEVIKTGKPFFFNTSVPHKIKTSYLVQSLIYVPLNVHGHNIGVLSVDVQTEKVRFSEKDVQFLTMLADYAAIAIENAQLYQNTELERSKLSSILTKIQDGVLVIDLADKILLANTSLRNIFGVPDDSNLEGLSFSEIFKDHEFISLIHSSKNIPLEYQPNEKHTYNLTISDLSQIGKVVTLKDITYLKEMDKVKTDFVNTVSHDLRSPLTTIVGYVELIERVGPINEKQKEFIERVQFSVRNITDLLNGLLNLGRIEVGVDMLNELVPFSPIISYAVTGSQILLQKKNQTLIADYNKNLPSIKGNPIHLRQVLDNLIENAVKYSPQDSRIDLKAWVQDDQIIVKITDQGIGIPPEEQQKIFSRFYRGSNVDDSTQGTGLGLAIVKTIVDNHQGRIWVESGQEHGSSFWVVLPIATEEPQN